MLAPLRFFFLVCWYGLMIFSAGSEVLSLSLIQATAQAKEAKPRQTTDPSDSKPMDSKSVNSKKDPFSNNGFETEVLDEELFTDIHIDDEELFDQNSAHAYIKGFLKEELAYRLHRNDPSLRKVCTILNLDAQSNLGEKWSGRMVLTGYYDMAYSLYGRDRFTTKALSQKESDLELRDTYVEGLLNEKLILKLGRQIIPWGQSEFVQVTDIANPRDQTEFAMVDLEDARLPVFASRITWIPEDWEFTLVAIHEIRPNKTDVKGTDFYPYQSLWMAGNRVTDEQVPLSIPRNWEVMGRLQRKFNGADFSLTVGDTFDDRAHLNVNNITMVAGRPQVILTPEYKRIQMIGMAGDKVMGDYLFKFDSGYFFNTAVARDDMEAQLRADSTGASALSWQKADILRTLVGVEYSGIDDLRLTIESVIEQIPNYQSQFVPDQTSAMIFFLADYQVLNQTLNYNFQWAFFSQYKERIYKLVITYDLMDAVELSLGAIYYQMDDSDSPLYHFRKQDRLFGSIKYSF